MVKGTNEKKQCIFSSIIIKSLNNAFKTTDEVMHFCQHWCEIPFIEKEEVKEIVKNLILDMIEFDNYRVCLFLSLSKILSDEDMKELSKITHLNVKSCIDEYRVFN